MNKKITRKGSGRTVGSGSFVSVSLSELNRILKPEAMIIVNRRFAELLKLKSKSFSATTGNLKNASEPEVEIEIKQL